MSTGNREYKFIAITGGIGSGKSAVGNVLRTLKYPVIDSDQIAREVVKPGKPALKEIEQYFGREILLPNRTLNRKKLREIISDSPEDRKALESITHPRIRELSQNLADSEFERTGSHLIFYEVPLLFESGRDHNFDAVICVWADDPMRISRTTKRDNLSEEAVKRLLSTQMDQEEKKSLSDYCIENNGTLENLETSVEKLLQQLLGS